MNARFPFPTRVPFSKERVEAEYVRHTATRCPNPDFHFSLVLPREWQPVDVPAAPPQPEAASELALFRPPGVGGVEIAVTGVLLDREVAPADWLDLLLEGTGHEVLRERRGPTPGGDVLDALSKWTADGATYLGRSFTLKDRDRLFLLEARTSEGDYGRYANDFLMAIAGFQLLNPSDWPLAERLRSFSRREPSDVLLLYPESWTCSEDPTGGADAMNVSFNNVVGDRSAGQVNVLAVELSLELSPQGVVDRYLEEVRSSGVPAGEVVLVPAQPVDGFVEAWEGETRAFVDGGEVEVRAFVGSRPDAWFLFAMLSPSRTTRADVWAINKRAFEVILQNVRTTGPAGPPPARA